MIFIRFINGLRFPMSAHRTCASGTVKLIAKLAGTRVIYDLQMSMDNVVTYTDKPSTLIAKTLTPKLTHYIMIFIRFLSLSKAGLST